ncbi:hypothetical protein SAI_1629 [Streptococcus agalactiae H36B]|nr:hypothetical protein SAI_1629 [Streptococcus agalactiae H36B]
MTLKPDSRIIFVTVDFPEAIPPVKPIIFVIIIDTEGNNASLSLLLLSS